MPSDIVVFVKADAIAKPPESMRILLVNTDGLKDYKTYMSLDEVAVDYPVYSRTYSQAKAIFAQIESLSGRMVDEIAIVGFPAPDEPADLLEQINTLNQARDDWYTFMTDQEDDEYIMALASWAKETEPTLAQMRAGIEDLRKFYIARTTNMELTAATPRCAVFYQDELINGQNNDEEIAAAALGNCAGFYPESVTWKFKQPLGITPTGVTRENKNRLERAYLNFFTTENKRNYIKNGVCSDGEFIDILLGRDHITFDMRNELYDIFLNHKNIPYDDVGFSIVGGAVARSLERHAKLHVIGMTKNRADYRLKIPTLSEAYATLSEDQIKARIMPDVVWSARLEGAVHSVTVQGVLKAVL